MEFTLMLCMKRLKRTTDQSYNKAMLQTTVFFASFLREEQKSLVWSFEFRLKFA